MEGRPGLSTSDNAHSLHCRYTMTAPVVEGTAWLVAKETGPFKDARVGSSSATKRKERVTAPTVRTRARVTRQKAQWLLISRYLTSCDLPHHGSSS